MDLTKKQQNKLMKGGAVQLSHSTLKTMNPEHLEHLEDKTVKKMVRALKEGRGIRLKLSEKEKESLGGKLDIGKAFRKAFDPKKNGVAKAFDPKQNGVAKAFNKTFTPELGNQIVGGLKEVGQTLKPIARPLINGLVDVGVGGLTTLAGNPELAPLLAPVANYGVNKALDKANLGFGVGKEELKKIKSMMVQHLKPHLEQKKHILPLVNKVFKHGDAILDMDEIPIKGGKISLKHIGREIIKGAKKIFHHAKPVIKHFGEKAIEHLKPLAKEAISGVAQSYGIDPTLADVGTSMLVDYGEKKAHRGLDKYLTKEASQTPEYALHHHGNKILDTLQNRGSDYINEYVPEMYRDSANQILTEHVGHHRQTLEESNPFGGMGTRGLYGGRVGLVRRVYTDDEKYPVVVSGGFLLQNHMGTLLDYTNPAMRPYIYPPNTPQGVKSGGSFTGYGGSFRGYGAIRQKYGGSFI